MNHKPRCGQSILKVQYYSSLSGKGYNRNNELSSSFDRPERQREMWTFTLMHPAELKQQSDLKLIPLVHLTWQCSLTEFTRKQHPEASTKAVGVYLDKYIWAQDSKQCAPPLMQTPHLVCLSSLSSPPE